MVDKPNTPVPPTATVPKPLPKVAPATPVSGFASATAPGRPDHTSDFKLPDKVTQAEIRDQSYKYGGGRKAGGETPSAPERDGRRS